MEGKYVGLAFLMQAQIVLRNLARAAEEIVSVSATVDARDSIVRREPANQEARSALARIQIDKKVLEVNSVLPPHANGEDK
jgi:hypothetical protein